MKRTADLFRELMASPRRHGDVLSAIVAARLEDCPILVADNVAAYVWARPDAWKIAAFPSLAPPWPEFWVEYPNEGTERRGVWVADVTAPVLHGHAGVPVLRAEHETRREAVRDATAATPNPVSLIDLGAAAVADAFDQEGVTPDAIRWVVAMVLFVATRDNVTPPVGWFAFALDNRGRVVGNRWQHDPGFTKEAIDEAADKMAKAFADADITAEQLDLVKDELLAKIKADAEEAAESRLQHMFRPALQSVAFLHCHNVVTETHSANVKVARKRQRRGGLAPLEYRTLRLELPRRTSQRSFSSGGGFTSRHHIVAGHFMHSGDCCPPAPTCTLEHTPAATPGCPACGGHLAHGKAFGRLTGIFFVPDHARGSTSLGQVRTDFEIKEIG